MNIQKLDPRAKAQQDVRDVRKRITQLDSDALDLLLSGARTHYSWQDRPVSDELIREIVKLTLDGPTSMNGSPARFVIVRSPEAKARLEKSLKPANIPKMRAAPATVIVAYDQEFWKQLLRLFPHEDRRHLFEHKPEYAAETAFRNGTLQGAYFMIAARALGLDVGALSGFSNKIVDEEFFADTSLKSNFLINLGYGNETALFGRLPRFDFEDVCKIL